MKKNKNKNKKYQKLILPMYKIMLMTILDSFY